MGKDIKQRILAEAMHELERHGHTFRMDDLAHRLNISKRTLYENFSSKEEIIDKVLANLQEDLYEQHRQLLGDDRLTADEKIVAFFAIRVRNVNKLPGRAIYHLMKKMPALAEQIKERSAQDWKLLETFVEEAQHSNQFIDFDKQLFMYMLAGTAREIFENLDKLDNSYIYPDAMEACIRVMLYGIKKNGGESTND